MTEKKWLNPRRTGHLLLSNTRELSSFRKETEGKHVVGNGPRARSAFSRRLWATHRNKTCRDTHHGNLDRCYLYGAYCHFSWIDGKSERDGDRCIRSGFGFQCFIKRNQFADCARHCSSAAKNSQERGIVFFSLPSRYRCGPCPLGDSRVFFTASLSMHLYANRCDFCASELTVTRIWRCACCWTPSILS